ncbi:MAG TPA: M48 family metallopeptidase [Streptosporangiaceae bacterium]|nr:M48 family metallopeptidase [Streptosporangiaceae bacterium]
MVESLYRQVSGSAARRPGWGVARVASYALAVLVLACSAGLIAAAVWLVLRAPNVATIIVAIVAVLLAIELRPRLGSLRKRDHVRYQGDAPALFGLLDRVAAELGARPVYAVVPVAAWNASYTSVGLRRRRVLTLGVPLWEALPIDQKLALLGHELAHGVNGDARHGMVVGTSLSTLARLYYVLRPGRADYTLARLAQALLSSVVAAVFTLQHVISLRASQRAEYVADALAARLASPASTADMLDTLVTGRDTHVFTVIRQKFTDETAGFWDEQRAALSSLPETEKDRRRRAEARQRLRVTESHPPAHLRIAVLRSRPPSKPVLCLTAAEEAQIRTELSADYARIARQIHESAQLSR